MTITPADLKLLASARMADTDDGGGQMTGTALQDGAENELFPDLSATDRAFGRLQCRKVYAAVLSTGTETLLGANVVLHEGPVDPEVDAWVMLSTGSGETRAQAMARLQQPHWEPLGPTGLVWAAAPMWHTRIKSAGGLVPLSVGSVVYTELVAGEWGAPVLVTACSVVAVNPDVGFGALGDGDVVYAVTLDGEIPAGTLSAARLGVPSPFTPRLASTRDVIGTLSIGATYCDVDTLLAQIVPRQPMTEAGESAQIGIDASAILPAGVAAAFRAGDGLVLHHTASVAAATYADGATVNCGRTGLAGVRVVGANGLGITTGWTANLTTGIVTISSIAGWSQPAVVQHTIEEVVACQRTGYPHAKGGSGGSATSEATAPFPLSEGISMYCGRSNAGTLRVYSKTGQDITDLTYAHNLGGTVRWFIVNLAAGTVMMSSGASSTAAFIASHSPVTLVASGSYSAVTTSSAAQATLNRITFNRALTKAFPAGSRVSSMLLMGDQQARTGACWSQQTWTTVWADSRIGDGIAAQYQQITQPIAVSNLGAISERWALVFLSSTTYRLLGETLGQVATGDTASDLAPINPATGVPYFTLQAEGFGGGWAAGNVLRINTWGANAGAWVARVTRPSAPSDQPDAVLLAQRGDQDA